ncbi:MAG TPA: hypothetical protein VFF29_00790, partial [Bacteroidota bacterium]|nr:hypothetical protein [Bacteroidota bacterium]
MPMVNEQNPETLIQPNQYQLKQRRGIYINIGDALVKNKYLFSDEEASFYESIDLIYRTLCSILYN